MAKMSSIRAAIVLGVMTSAPMPAFADPVTKADLAGKKICWSAGYVATYGKNGSIDWTGRDAGHGTWRLEGDQLVVRWPTGGGTATITKENGVLHTAGSRGDDWGKYCN
jgi:hypothetical protein